MKTHPLVGERLLSSVRPLRAIAPIVRSAHERWDGGGYPDALAAEQIPLAARVITACDAYDAMISDRPYTDALSSEVVAGSPASASAATLSLSIAAAVKSARAPNAGASSEVVRPPLGCGKQRSMKK